MNKKLAERLKKAVPENGTFDLSFNTTSGIKQGQVGSTVILTLLKKNGETSALIMDKKITVSAFAEDISTAQTDALDSALTLLGV